MISLNLLYAFLRLSFSPINKNPSVDTAEEYERYKQRLNKPPTSSARHVEGKDLPSRLCRWGQQRLRHENISGIKIYLIPKFIWRKTLISGAEDLKLKVHSDRMREPEIHLKCCKVTLRDEWWQKRFRRPFESMASFMRRNLFLVPSLIERLISEIETFCAETNVSAAVGGRRLKSWVSRLIIFSRSRWISLFHLKFHLFPR